MPRQPRGPQRAGLASKHRNGSVHACLRVTHVTQAAALSPVTTTSKNLGFRMSCMAALSMYLRQTGQLEGDAMAVAPAVQ